MTTKEFDKLPEPVKQLLNSMGVTAEDIRVVNDWTKHPADKNGNVILMGGLMNAKMPDDKNPAHADMSPDDIMSMIQHAFETAANNMDNDMDADMDDETPEKADCPLTKFKAYLEKDPRKIELMSGTIATNPAADDALIAKMFNATPDCVALTRAFTEKMGPVRDFLHGDKPLLKPYLVPVTGLVKVYAANEEEALYKVHMAVENEDYAMPVHHDCLPDIDEVFGATMAYNAHQLLDETVDDVIDGDIGNTECPFCAVCEESHE